MNNNDYKVGIYIRLSKEDENKDKRENSESIKNQRGIIKKYLSENNYDYTFEYVDDGYSGSNFDRPSFKRMIKDIEDKRINMVIVKDLSRLGRNNIETNEYIDRYFPKHQVRFISILDNVDSKLDTLGNEMVPFKILMNEYFNRITSKNIRAALKSKKENGLYLGWKAPYGYKKDDNNKNKIIIDLESSKVVKRIFNLAESGKSIQFIANYLNKKNIQSPRNSLWSYHTIKDILFNEVYIGNLVQGKKKKIYGIKKEINLPKEEWIISLNNHEPIISKELFIRAQKNTKKGFTKLNNNYLLKKIIRCQECGYAIGVYKKKNRKYMYTMCTYYQKNIKNCTTHSMNYNILEKEIINTLKNICLSNIDKEKINNYFKNKIVSIDYINKIKNDIATYDQYLANTYIDMIKGNISCEQYKLITTKLNKEKSYLIEELSELFNTSFNNIEDLFRSINRELLLLLVDKITIDKNKNVYMYLSFTL